LLTDTYVKIGHRVKAFRKEKGYSQDELAAGICSRQTVSLLENGQHVPSVDIIQKIADRLGIPLHEIVVDEVRGLEAKVQLEIAQVYTERGEYADAFPLLEELERREDLLEFVRRDLMICQAECLMRTGKQLQAIENLTDLLSKLEKQREQDDQFMARVYNKLGNAFYLNSDNVQAYSAYQRAYQISQRFPFNLISADISFNLGMVCSLMPMKREALSFYEKAKGYYSEVADVRKLANTLFNLALVHREMNDIKGTEDYLEQALVLYESLNMLNRVYFAKQEHAYHVLFETEPEQAVQELTSCSEQFEQLGDIPRLIYSYTRLANVLLKIGRYEDAEKFLLLTLTYFTEEESKKYPHMR
jgi:transcriptional regulator with XRE-family HTH domain